MSCATQEIVPFSHCSTCLSSPPFSLSLSLSLPFFFFLSLLFVFHRVVYAHLIILSKLIISIDITHIHFRANLIFLRFLILKALSYSIHSYRYIYARMYILFFLYFFYFPLATAIASFFVSVCVFSFRLRKLFCLRMFRSFRLIKTSLPLLGPFSLLLLPPQLRVFNSTFVHYTSTRSHTFPAHHLHDDYYYHQLPTAFSWHTTAITVHIFHILSAATQLFFLKQSCRLKMQDCRPLGHMDTPLSISSHLASDSATVWLVNHNLTALLLSSLIVHLHPVSLQLHPHP